MLDRTGRSCYNTFCSAGLAHLVERHLAKVEVASSSLVARSRKDHSSIWMGDLFYCLVCKLGLAASTATRGACFLNHRGPAGFLQIAAGGLRDAGCGFEPRSPLHTKAGHPAWMSCFFHTKANSLPPPAARSAVLQGAKELCLSADGECGRVGGRKSKGGQL